MLHHQDKTTPGIKKGTYLRAESLSATRMGPQAPPGESKSVELPTLSKLRQLAKSYCQPRQQPVGPLTIPGPTLSNATASRQDVPLPAATAGPTASHTWAYIVECHSITTRRPIASCYSSRLDQQPQLWFTVECHSITTRPLQSTRAIVSEGGCGRPHGWAYRTCFGGDPALTELVRLRTKP